MTCLSLQRLHTFPHTRSIWVKVLNVYALPSWVSVRNSVNQTRLHWRAPWPKKFRKSSRPTDEGLYGSSITSVAVLRSCCWVLNKVSIPVWRPMPVAKLAIDNLFLMYIILRSFLRSCSMVMSCSKWLNRLCPSFCWRPDSQMFDATPLLWLCVV